MPRTISVKPHELKSSIQRTGLAPLYLVVGEEPFFRDQSLATIRSAALGDPNREGGQEHPGSAEGEDTVFNYDLLYGDETDAQEILAYAQEISFFSAKRLVVVKWADKLPSREGEALIPYLQSPADTTTLVLVGAKLDGRLKWVQTVKSQAVTVDCAPLFENQRVGWIRQQATFLELRLDESALQLLKELAAEGLCLTRSELVKLATYLPAGSVGNAKDVEAVRGIEPGASVFDLADAIGRDDPGWALHVVAKNLEVGEQPLRILGALVWQVRRIWKAKDLLEAGIREHEVVRTLRIPPFRAAEFFRQVRGWNQHQLRSAWALFCETDSSLKGGAAGSPTRVLTALILSLCHASSSEPPKPSRVRGGQKVKPY